MTIVRYLPYILTLHSPAVLTDVGGDPNSSASLGYIPGAAIRGAVARRIGDPDSNPTRTEFDRLILGGTVRYLNAYPMAGDIGRPEELVRAFPSPLSLRMEKDAPAKAHDLASPDCRWPDAEDGPKRNEPLMPIEHAFLTLDPGGYRAAVVPLEGTIHNQRDRERGRAWKRQDGTAAGAIFHYQSVIRDERFGGLVVLEGDSEQAVDDLAGEVRKHLQGNLLLGRSRRSEYGGDATLVFGNLRKRELAHDARAIAAGQRFRCVLLSRYVGRKTSTGQPDPRAIEDELVYALGPGVSVEGRFVSFAIAGGYNNKWRLQLPQVLALEAGSVLVLQSTQPIDGQTLTDLEAAGFGERRIEGFGRVAFLPIDDTHPVPKPPAARKPPPAPATAPPALVVEIEKRLIRVHLERAIDRYAADLAGSPSRAQGREDKATRNIPSPALLARIRTPLRNADVGLQEISGWLDPRGNSGLARRAMDALERCRLTNGRNLAEWLRATATDGPTLPDEKRARLAQRAHVVDANSANAFIAEACEDRATRVRLIDATLAILIRHGKLAD